MAKKQKSNTAKNALNRKLLYSVVLLTLVLLAVLVVNYIFQPHTESWTAAIIDQLTVEAKLTNSTFIANSTSILNASGFDAKYYPSEDVKLNFYKDLPSKGRKIIILRAHSSVRDESDFVDLFTSEPYDDFKAIQYVADYGNQISRAEFLVPPNNDYFAIGPTFVDLSMRGRFDSDCVIILMGCNSLNKTTMAEALVRRGAKVVIGWTNWIDLGDTDASTLQLLRYLLAKDPYTIQGAVEKINELEHPFGATLDYYPKEAKSYIIPTKRNEVSPSSMMETFQFLFFILLAKWKHDI